jgi:predicted PurR-regulated permease PerM
MSASSKIQHNFFLIIFIAALIVMYYIWRPFLGAIVTAASLAIVFHPVYDRLTHRLKGRKSLAAMSTVGIVLACVFIPLILIGGLLFGEVKNLYISIASNADAGIISNAVTSLEDKIHRFIPDISLDITRYIQSGLQWMVSHLDAFFSGFVSILLGTFIMVIALYYFLRDGRIFKEKIFTLSPLKRDFDQVIFNKITRAINSVVKGSITISVIQGFFATIGFAVAGVPNPILWGVIATLSSLIPGVGTSLVTVPAIVYLFLTQPIAYGIGLTIWAVLGIGMIDNFLAPYLLNRGMNIHPFLILLSVLGGIVFFGPIGFIMGPVMLAFFFALLEIYPMIISNDES